MADTRLSFNNAPPYETVEEDYPPESTQTNNGTSQSNLTKPFEDQKKSIANAIYLLIKDAFTTTESSHQTTQSARTKAALIALVSIFVGPIILYRMIIESSVEFALICASISVGISTGFKVILILDKFVPIPKYLVVDIGILVTFIISPVMIFVVSNAVIRCLSVLALAKYLFLLIVLSGNLQTFRYQTTYVVVLLLLVIMSSFGTLLIRAYAVDNIHEIDFNPKDEEYHMAFFCTYGIVLFLVGLPRIHSPAVCIAFVWYGMWFLSLFGQLAQYFASETLLVAVFVLLLCFWIGLMRSTTRYSNSTENLQPQTQNVVVRFLFNCWECHKRVVEIDTSV